MSTSTLSPPRAPAAIPWKTRLAGSGQTHGALAALVLLVLINAIITPHFATFDNLWNILLQVATVVLVGIGMTLVMATGGVDLSVGSLMAVASVVAVAASPHGTVAAIAAGLAVGLGLGALNGVIVTRGGVEPFIATLGMQIAGRGLAQVITHGGALAAMDDPVFASLLGQGSLGPVPAPVLITTAAVLLALFVVHATVLGRYLVAVGGNGAAAHLAGIPVQRVRWAAFAASGLLAGLAGLIETARLGATDPSNIGAGIEFPAIFGAVIGGTSLYGGQARVLGTVFGLLILAVIGTAFNMLLVPYAWTLILQAAIILTAVALQRPRRA